MRADWAHALSGPRLVVPPPRLTAGPRVSHHGPHQSERPRHVQNWQTVTTGTQAPPVALGTTTRRRREARRTRVLISRVAGADRGRTSVKSPRRSGNPRICEHPTHPWVLAKAETWLAKGPGPPRTAVAPAFRCRGSQAARERPSYRPTRAQATPSSVLTVLSRVTRRRVAGAAGRAAPAHGGGCLHARRRSPPWPRGAAVSVQPTSGHRSSPCWSSHRPHAWPTRGRHPRGPASARRSRSAAVDHRVRHRLGCPGRRHASGGARLSELARPAGPPPPRRRTNHRRGADRARPVRARPRSPGRRHFAPSPTSAPSCAASRPT